LKTSPSLGGTTTVPAILAGAIGERWERFAAELMRSRRRRTEPGIHDLRVAIRRLTAVLTLVDALFPRAVRPKTLRTLDALLTSLSALRDIHVLLLTVRSLVRRFPPLRPMLALLNTKRTALGRDVGRLIARCDVAFLEREISRIASSIMAATGSPAAEGAMRSVLIGLAGQRFLRLEERRMMIAGGDPKSLHRMRVAFKKLRYTVESILPLLPGVTKGGIKAMGPLQDRMGEIQDIEVLITAVNDHAASHRVASSLLPLLQYLALRRRELVDAFVRDMAGGDMSRIFGAGIQAPLH